MRKQLVICDDEIRYATKLGENISEREDVPVRVHVCSTLESAMQVAEHLAITILLISDTFPVDERAKIPATHTFVLVHGKEWDGTQEEHPIFKYQSVHEIWRKVMEVYASHTEEKVLRPIRQESASIIGIYSPVHRVGKTTLALALGRELASEKKTLYINLETYAGFEHMDGVTLGELLYYMKQGRANLKIRMETIAKEESGLYYLAPMKMVSDLRDITEKEWKVFLRELANNTSYERIILDLGESIQGLYEVLELCDRIYMPVGTGDTARRKIQSFDYNIQQLGKGNMLQRIYRFEMPENIAEFAKKQKQEGL